MQTTAAFPRRGFTLQDFDFELPPELIAQSPAAVRSASRLLDATAAARAVDSAAASADDTALATDHATAPTAGAPPADRTFRDLPGLLRAGDLLVFNDTRVIKARLHGVKDSGGAVEALVERLLPGQEVLAHLRASKSPKAGSRIRFAEGAFEAEVLGRGGADGSLFHLRFPAEPEALLAAHGHVPLPPYITHADTEDDERRYQTIFAARPGAVAAPTAALHFDEKVLADLAERGVGRASITLHVGAGTFLPMRSERIADHVMHSEWFEVPEATVAAIEATRAAGGRIVAVGTTTLRALESAALGGRLEAGSRDTDIFITPGFDFRVVDLLVTNFHLPKSTLMMLVSAFAGFDRIRALYAHAVHARYRFFSYGDAMLLQRGRDGAEAGHDPGEGEPDANPLPAPDAPC